MKQDEAAKSKDGIESFADEARSPKEPKERDSVVPSANFGGT